jgi:Tol biopolymer transport system component
MRSRGLLLRVRTALRRVVGRLVLASVALALAVPAPVAATTGRTDGDAPARVTAAPLPAPRGTTTLVSKSRDGGFPDGRSDGPAISGDGRWVAFASTAPDIVRGDTNGTSDVFLVDRTGGRTIRLPVLRGMVPRDGFAAQPAISADGRVVAFTYQPPPSDLAGPRPSQVLAYDRATGTSTLVSPSPQGSPGTGASEPAVSADGRYVAFTQNWGWIGSPNDAVVRFDRREARSVVVSKARNGRTVSGTSITPSISGDGSLVAFASDGGRQLVAETVGPGFQVFVRDLDANTTRLVSAARDGGAANGASGDPAISRDGRYVAFASAATNLAGGPGAGSAGLFRRDLRTGRTIMVSLTPDGTASRGSSLGPSIGPNGNMVAFTSSSTDLAPTGGQAGPSALDSPRVTDVYLRDIAAGETVLISVTVDGRASQQDGNRSESPALAGNGRYVAFASDSPRLVDGDTGRRSDVFLRDLPPVPTLTPSVLDLGARAVGLKSAPGAVVLSNTGWSPLTVKSAVVTGAHRKDFTVVSDGCAKRVLKRNQACTVSVVFRPVRKGKRSATLAIADSYTGSPRTASLRGSGSQAVLTLDPPVGPPGIVTIVEGAGFPSGSTVRLHWSEGITPQLDDVVADAVGSFRVPVLVFHNDVTGRRDLVAESVAGDAFPGVEAEMDVVAPSAIPPTFARLRIVDLPFMLVFRR